ncbi:hypothetical protein BXZ70DRAFT_271325 [Cristinia sonorae]|uniref:Replication protein A C-terminal domain-containing protein n=1 Tax=Cristinia sonorae TaxID=1940300 RepID=A0A8K0XV01_9AGAR|nr:hypothetical protein BXZ70DRAFT_271325 [Cristinia sonorae]
MADDSFYQDGAGTQHPDFGTQDDTGSSLTLDWQTALRPVTIRQLHDAKLPYSRADFTINGREVKNLAIVAHVVDQNDRIDGDIRRVTYDLEDGTSRGRIKAFYQCDPRFPAPEFPLKYGRFIGTLLRPGEQNYLKVHRLQPVVDPHEIYYHLLQVVTFSLIQQRGIPTTDTESSEVQSPPQAEARPIEKPTEAPATKPPAPEPSQPAETANSSEEFFVLMPDQENDFELDGAFNKANDLDEPENEDAPPESDTESESGDSFRTAEEPEIPNARDALSPLNTAIAGLPAQERDPYSHLTNLQRDVLLYLYNVGGQDHREFGTPIGTMVWGLRATNPNVNASALGDAIDKLLDDGYIYEKANNCFCLTDIPGRGPYFRS